MKKILYRIICVCLAVLTVLLTSAACGSSGADFALPTRTLVSEEIKSFGSFDYQVYDDGSIKIVAYSGGETAVVVPETIEGGRVVELGSEVFTENTQLQSVKMPSVEIIGDYAFYGCTSLGSITFGKKLWSVGLAVFSDTPWLAAQTDEFVIIGDGLLLKYQGSDLIVTIPEEVKHIASAFEMNEQLVGVECGEGVLTIGKSAFMLCTALRYATLGSRIVLIDAGAFDSCESLATVNIPDSVEIIGDYAFNYCSNLSYLKIGSSVRTIGNYAFRNCMRVKVLELPATVESVGVYGFADCFSLSSGMVFYGGSAAQFEALELDTTNYILRDADKIYAE